MDVPSVDPAGIELLKVDLAKWTQELIVSNTMQNCTPLVRYLPTRQYNDTMDTAEYRLLSIIAQVMAP